MTDSDVGATQRGQVRQYSADDRNGGEPMTRAFQDHQIRRYLLGELSAPEEAELEIAYFGDPDLLARLEIARHDLVDDYAAARLSEGDRKKVEQRILATADGREQVALARTLRKTAGGADEIAQKVGWAIDRRWLSVAAALLLAFGGYLAWRVVSGPERVAGRSPADRGPRVVQSEPPAASLPPNATSSDPQAPTSEAPRASSPPKNPALTVATLILTADLDRSRRLPPTLRTSSATTHVELVAPRDGLKPGAARVRVESVEGASVWSGSMTVPEEDAPDPRPRARVPTSVLPPGDYLFAIESTVATDPTGGPRYYFRVRAQ